MSKLFGKFERGISFVWALLASVIFALSLVVMFSTNALAEVNQDGRDEPFTSTDQVVLTRILDAPEGITADGTFEFQFTKVSYGGIPVSSQEDANMPTFGDGGIATLPLTIKNGQITSSGDNLIYTFQEGPGTITTEDESDNTDASGLVYEITKSTQHKAYIVQQRITSLLQSLTGFTFTTAGEYVYRIAEKQCTGSYEGIKSSAAYTLKMYVAYEDSTYKVTGFVLQQDKIDAGTGVLIAKKDPRLNYGKSNDKNSTVVPVAGGDPVNYYRGFTFASAISTSGQAFFIEKNVTGKYPDKNKDFKIYPEFYNYDWTIGDNIYGYIYDGKDAANNVLVTFTVKSLDAGYRAAWVTKVGDVDVSDDPCVKLKHGYQLKFDGETVSGQVTSLLPVGTTYGYYEDLSEFVGAECVGSAQTYKADSDDAVSTAETSEPHKLTVSYDAGNDNAIIAVPKSGGTNIQNKSIITNDMNPTPTGFLVDILPYVLMIGIPIVAFIIWIVTRRRKYNK